MVVVCAFVCRLLVVVLVGYDVIGCALRVVCCCLFVLKKTWEITQ